MGVTPLRNLPIEKRKKVREALLRLREIMVEQNKAHHELFLLPNEKAIQVIDDTLKRNQQTFMLKSIEECQDCLEKTRARYKDVYKLFGVKK